MQNNSKAIIEALQTLPGWVDFDPDPNKWTEEQIAARMPVWRILPSYWKKDALPSPKEKLWLAICNGTLIGWNEDSRVPSGPSAPGQHDLRRLRAELGIQETLVTPPPNIADAFLQLGRNRYRRDPELMFIRNEWIERAAAASVVRELVRPWIYETRRLIVQAGLDPSPVDELMESTYMQDEVVDSAVAVLRKVDPHNREVERTAVIPRSLLKDMTGKDAAKVIGVTEYTLSRWQGETPAWASEAELLFKHLMERNESRYERDSVLKLQAWFREAMKSGGQEPTPCP